MTARALRKFLRLKLEQLDVEDCPVHLAIFDHKTARVVRVSVIGVVMTTANTLEVDAQWADGALLTQRRVR